MEREIEQFYDIIKGFLEKEQEQLSFEELRAYQDLEINLARKVIGLGTWGSFQYAVIDFSSEHPPTFNGFQLVEEAIEFSQKLQVEKFKTKSNPYFVGHVFYRDFVKLDEPFLWL